MVALYVASVIMLFCAMIFGKRESEQWSTHIVMCFLVSILWPAWFGFAVLWAIWYGSLGGARK